MNERIRVREIRLIDENGGQVGVVPPFEALKMARERGLASTFGDAVTIHPFSQRAERSHGYREAALMLGMVPAQTTMRGFGGEGPGRRTAALRSYCPFDERPRAAALPAPYGGLLEDVYANVGLSLEARSARAPLEGEAVTTEVEPAILGGAKRPPSTRGS